MPARAPRTRSPTSTTTVVHRGAVMVMGESANSNNQRYKMGEELPILKGILNGVVNYHNARTCEFFDFRTNSSKAIYLVVRFLIFVYFLFDTTDLQHFHPRESKFLSFPS